jgi:hypothetical protein
MRIGEKDWASLFTFRSVRVEQKAKGQASFGEQKEANLIYAGSLALSATMPMAQRSKSFCVAFFKKRPYPG